MCMTVVIVVAMVFVIVMIIVAILFMVIVAVIIVVVMIIVAMLFMVVVIVMAMLFMVVVTMVIMIAMLIVSITAMGVNETVKVFSLSVNKRRPDGTLNGENTVIGETPFEDITKLAINGVMLRLAIEVGFQSSMTLDGDHWSDPEFPLGHLFTTTMAAVGMNPTDCSITSQQQGQTRSSIQKRKTRKDHWIKKSEMCAVESAN